MPEIDQTVSHYRIIEKLGKGGMGEVYQAKDTKLGRDVAIKVLPEEFAKDVDRVARFQREAKLLASLNHPNIAAIYGIEESDGTNILVMELVEGQTLGDRIKAGAIPVEEALRLALQIAEALEAAHEKGVIHRDLKPANIMVTPGGKVKVLDFGLAKAFAGDEEDGNLPDSPTLSARATRQGVILGTAAYMSPEQARGEMVDKKADIWAFGVVLFEMLTGRQTFTGETVSDTLASVLAREPEWNGLPANLHPRIRFFLERCLKKKPKNRLSGISDARVEIQDVLDDPSGVFAQPVTTTKPQKKIRLVFPWVAAALVLWTIIAGIVFWLFQPSSPEPFITRFSVDLEGRLNDMDSIAISPDGRCFVYSANSRLYLQELDQLEARAIPGTEEGSQPFFSPDGESIAFFTPTQLKKVALTGVAPVVLTELSAQGLVGTWDFQDRIFFGQGGAFSLYQVPANGGKPEVFAELGDHADFDYPDVLPGGEWVLFTDLWTSGKWSNANIVAQSVATGERKLVIEGGHFARYAPTGHLVYAQNSNLFAVGFDTKRVETVGNAVPVVQGITTSEISGHAKFALSKNGTLVYVPETSMTPYVLEWVDKDGKEQPTGSQPDIYSNPRISPDGTRVALAIDSDGNKDIWIWHLVRKTMTRLTFDEANDDLPLWTPDGKRIAFASNRDGNVAVYWKSADGTGETEALVTDSAGMVFPASWAGDGNTMVIMEFTSSLNVGVLSMEDDHELKLLLQEKYIEAQPQVSPDGRWIAYMSDESGQGEIYVRPFPEINKGKWQVSKSGGKEPVWARDGRKLFYRNEDEIMAVPVNTEPTFSFETPEVLFKLASDYLGMESDRSWDVSPDGDRLLMIKESVDESSAPEDSRPKIIVAENWFEELKERVPVK